MISKFKMIFGPFIVDSKMTFSSSQLTARRKMFALIVTIIVVIGCYIFVIRRPLNVYRVESFFESPMSDKDKAVLHRTLVALVGVLDRINATYFMASGTLIGSYRHHGFIPWDDDVDLIINTVDKVRLYDALLALAPSYVVHKLTYPLVQPLHWKLFSAKGTFKVPLRPYRWPSVDILFYDEDDKYIWNESPWFADERWPKSAVFPLVRRPFEGLWLPAPCDTAAVLAVNFDPDQCASRIRNHIYDVPFLTSIIVPCDNLRKSFSFVDRVSPSTTNTSASIRRLGRGRNRLEQNSMDVESLTIDGKTLHTFIVHSKC